MRGFVFRDILRLILIIFLCAVTTSCRTRWFIGDNDEKEQKTEQVTEEEKNQQETEQQKKTAPEEENEKSSFVEAPLDVAEFRGAWVATVANINWPSKPGLNSEIQKKEALKILDAAEKAHLNAIILQVRPQADAFYPSELEPWSYYLSGKMGKAPQPYYDPLKFWIEEAHQRGLELHVWLNPYRAHHTTAGEIGEESVVKEHPSWVMELKNGMWWMDPANQNVQDYASAVVMDIVKRYDIDAVHFDDYFYPYASYNGKKDFPDDKSWEQYKAKGGELSRAEWRRKNVNDFLQRIAEQIKQEKSYVKFGISPFGIWRPDYPSGIKGMDQYNELYADAKLWLNKGWIDYFTPQLYWASRQMGQSFPVLLGWWDSENVTSRHLWPGVNLALEEKKENKGEIATQVMISRGILRDDPGVVHWNIGPLIQNKELDSSLVNGPYEKEALVPASPWLDDEPPLQPILEIDKTDENIQLSWRHAHPEDVFRWVVYFRYQEKGWDFTILNEDKRNFSLPKKDMLNNNLKEIGITAVDRTGNESSFESFEIRNLLP